MVLDFHLNNASYSLGKAEQVKQESEVIPKLRDETPYARTYTYSGVRGAVRQFLA